MVRKSREKKRYFTNDSRMLVDPFTKFTQKKEGGETDSSMGCLGHLEESFTDAGCHISFIPVVVKWVAALKGVILI